MEDSFERFWMIKYIDKKLDVDSSYTYSALDWQPTARYHLTRRLLFLLEKMKSYPDEWRVKNEAALKRTARRTNLMIYEKMMEQKDVLLTRINEIIINENPKGNFTQYKELAQTYFNVISVLFIIYCWQRLEAAIEICFSNILMILQSEDLPKDLNLIFSVEH